MDKLSKKLRNFYQSQIELLDFCKELDSKLGLKNKISFKLYLEDEFSVLYEPRFYLKAPCGCCSTTPYVYPSNIEEMVEKFEKIIYIDDEIRKQIDELEVMYSLDLLNIFGNNSEYAGNEEIEEIFWKMDSDEIIELFAKRWNELLEEDEEEDIVYN